MSPRFSPHVAAFIGIVFVVLTFLGGLYWMMIRGHYESQRHDAHDLWQDKTELAGRFISESMLRHDFQDVERFLISWVGGQPRIIELRAVAANGFVITDFRRAADNGQDLVTLKRSITHNGQHLIDLNVTVDFGYLTEKLRHSTATLLASYVLFVILLAGLIWMAVRHLALLPLERSRRDLVASERHYRRLVELLPDAVVEHSEGRLLFANRAAVTLFGAGDPRDLLGKQLDQLVEAEEPGAFEAHTDESGNPVPKLMPVEGLALRPDGKAPVDILSTKSGPAQSDTVLTILRDITIYKAAEAALIRAKEQAEVANRAKTEMLTNMSHELRTPLNAIIGFSDIMANAAFGPLDERYQNYSKDINDSGQHLLELINDILDVSAVEAGKLELHEEALDLEEMATSAIRLVRPRADAGGVALISDLAPGLPRIRGDARRIKQILLNLLSNSVKFTQSGGQVWLSAKANGNGGMVLSVADSGIGMDKAGIAKAMMPFGQVDGSLSRTQQGSGLGLPLAKGLTELHGGSMEIESEPGRGTTVTINLPASRVV